MASFQPSSSRASCVALILLLGLPAYAQLNIPLTQIQLANASLPAVTISLDGTFRNGLPSPFLITTASLPLNAQWFCMDPTQGMYYAGSPEPSGNSLHFASTNPADYNLWGLNAPGLSAARVQDLADLFHAYLPLANNSLTLGAIQMAVWEIANESNSNAYSLSDGFLQATPYNGSNSTAMITAANALLASLVDPAVMDQGNTASLGYLIDGSYQRNGTNNTALVQDLIVYIPPVPEPSTYGIIGAGLLLVVCVRRRLGGKTSPGLRRAN